MNLNYVTVGLGLIGFALAGCSGNDDSGDRAGGANSGGSAASGASSLGGAGTGGNKATGGSSSGGASSLGGASTGGNKATGGSSSGGASSLGGASTGGNKATGGAAGKAGSAGSSGATTTAGATGWAAGNPDGSCSTGIPAAGQLVATTTPTTVVGTGTAASCTFSALDAAVRKGGIVTFDCGAAPVTIAVTATLPLPNNRNTVIDGGRKITLDGGNTTQILRFDNPGWMDNDFGVTLQRIRLINGKSTPKTAIPPAPPPCASGWEDGQGGALYVRNGVVRIIDSIFDNNHGAPLGPDTGGGAVYLLGCRPAFIVGSTFTNNTASNAGGLGALFAELTVINSYFSGNQAIGDGANANDPSKCSVIHAGHNQVGSGGNGGALYSDGVGVDVNLCGTRIVGNEANEFGAALFFTSNDSSNLGDLTIRDSHITGNVQGNDYWQLGGPGISTNANVVPAVNSVITK